MRLVPPEIINPRLVDGDGAAVVFPDRHFRVDGEKTLYIGNLKDDVYWRVYWKRTNETFVGDDEKRHPKPLPESEWRARAEVHVSGNVLEKLGIKYPADLMHFSFERLHSQGYFKFGRKNDDAAQVLMSNGYSIAVREAFEINENSPAFVLGMFGTFDKRHRDLKLSRYLETDTELTESARLALRGLTSRFGS